MAEPIHRTLQSAVKTTEGLYHRLVLLVGQSGSGKTTVLQAFSSRSNLDIINVNAKLSERLLEMTAKQRTLRLPKLLEQITATGSQTVVLDNLEILFDVELRQDPLRLLQHISRNRNVVAAWNGRMDGQKLIYAEPGHREYREYKTKDVVIVNIGEAENL
jgi:DNA polymerase III delta prime subunit